MNETTTIETTETTTTATEIKPSNLYPFTTKAQIKARLESDPDFRCEAMVTLLALQTAFEQATESTKDRNRQGFMSSHAVNGTRVARKIATKQELSEGDWGFVNKIAPRYSRQLATVIRARELTEQPGLAGVAALFGVKS